MDISIMRSIVPSDHKFIVFSDKPKKGLNTEAGFLIVDHYLRNVKQSRDKWRKEARYFNVHWEDFNKQAKSSKSLNYLIIAEYIRKKSSFKAIDFDLPEMQCFWLDHSMDMKMNWHMHDHTGTFGMGSGDLQNQYGVNYPLKPSLNREGKLYTTFQPQLLKRVISQRSTLINDSMNALEDDWTFILRGLISDAISLLDITLTQLYIKAQYDPLPGWRFDKQKLGERHGKRLNDKLKWIHQITGANLNIESERDSLESLKNLRNHLMHFDPPSLVITVEEATVWLNQIIDIGIILIKMRKAMGVDISEGLVNFILQKEAIFVPRNAQNRKAIGQSKNEDYRSSTWESI